MNRHAYAPLTSGVILFALCASVAHGQQTPPAAAPATRPRRCDPRRFIRIAL